MEPLNKILLLCPDKADLQSGPDQKWVEQLAFNMGLILEKYAGSSLHTLTPESKNQAEQLTSPVFLIQLMHDSYASSGKFVKFLEKVVELGGDLIRHISRIDTSAGIVVKIPDVFRSAASAELFEATGNNNEVRPIGEDSTLYWSRLLDLAAEVKILSGQAAGASSESPASRIYLAQAAPDMRRNRNILKRELLEYGFDVVPDTDLKFRSADLKSYIQNLVDKSRMVVHLLGNAYGEPMKDTGYSLAETQMQYITGYIEAIGNDPVHAEKELERLIWIDPEFNPVDSQQEEFINQLKRNIENLHRTEIIQTPLELFKSLIINRLRKKQHAISVPGKESREKGTFIYILHAADDQDKAAELARGLSSGAMGAGMLDYGKQQRNLLSDHKSYLKECDAAVIYYNTPNRPWLQSKVMDLLKAPGLGRDRSLSNMQVLAGKQDPLEDYSPPAGISVLREPDLSKASKQLLKNIR
jgi:hypothetical protein